MAQADSVRAVGLGVRAFVAAFLSVFVVCGLLQVEAWPFSGWQLFSRVRTAEIKGWLATGVGTDGTERPIPFGSFAAGHRGELGVLKGFEGLSAADRRAVCRAWADEMTRIGAGVVEIRIYATTYPARDLEGGGGGRRDLRHVCPSL
jgi:hypothetical protein